MGLLCLISMTLPAFDPLALISFALLILISRSFFLILCALTYMIGLCALTSIMLPMLSLLCGVEIRLLISLTVDLIIMFRSLILLEEAFLRLSIKRYADLLWNWAVGMNCFWGGENARLRWERISLLSDRSVLMLGAFLDGLYRFMKLGALPRLKVECGLYGLLAFVSIFWV